MVRATSKATSVWLKNYWPRLMLRNLQSSDCSGFAMCVFHRFLGCLTCRKSPATDIAGRWRSWRSRRRQYRRALARALASYRCRECACGYSYVEVLEPSRTLLADEATHAKWGRNIDYVTAWPYPARPEHLLVVIGLLRTAICWQTIALRNLPPARSHYSALCSAPHKADQETPE